MNPAAWQAFAAQARIELVLSTRRVENLLVTLGVPVVLLLFFATVPVLPAPTDRPRIDALVAGVLTVAVMSTGLVSLAISTAFERGYGVLKRLAATPLPMPALVGAKASTVVVTVLLQLLLVALVATLLGWSPPGGPVAACLRALPWVLLGTVAFSALGLSLAALLRPEAVLAAANGLFLLAVLLGGVVVPLDQLPGIIALPVSVLPPALLARLLDSALAAQVPELLPGSLLAVYAAVLAALAVSRFRVARLA